MGFRSVILSPAKAQIWLKDHTPKGIILSGGSASVYEENAPYPPKEILELGAPILGICYGMQWLTRIFGGSITASRDKKKYGKTKINFCSKDDLLFSGIKKESVAWASHGDSISILPKGFSKISHSSEDVNVIEGMSNLRLKIWGLQFHPEVADTEFGKDMLNNFALKISQCAKDWEPQNIIADIRKETKKNCCGKAIIGFSGGVDSTTLAAVLSPVLKDKLLAVCINTGALRENEIDEIKEKTKIIGVNLKIIDAQNRFETALKNVIDAETKRKEFKKIYKEIFEETLVDFRADYIIQGSLATDFIESGAVGNAALIKSHHNIGLDFHCEELHPFKDLFKYEIRELAKALELPDLISLCKPFPGPGLFIRVIGAPPTKKNLDILRWADSQTRRIITDNDLNNKFSQLIVALNCTPTVGVKGDGRVYAHSVVVRAISTSDFMTAKGYQIPPEVRQEITTCLTKHPEIVRVWFDETNKPPATVEFE